MMGYGTGAAPLRVGMDMSIARHPRGGSLRWASGLLTALGERPELEVFAWRGHRRIHRGGPVRKIVNLLRDEVWLEVELPYRARREHADVLLMPVNVTSGHTHVPQVVTILDVNFLAAPGTYDRAYATYARRRFVQSLATAERITTISEHSRDQIVEHLGGDPARITVVYPGLEDPTRGEAMPPPLPGPYALYVGQTEPHKDVPTAIEAMRDLRDLGIDLAIVGQPGRDHERVRALAAAQRGIHVVGAVGDAELENWYAHASVFLFPSLTEGFGFPPLEAMARGVPVVAARAGSLPEVLQDAALLHEAGSAEDLAANVRRVLTDAALEKGLIERGKARSGRFTWSAAAQGMSAVLAATAGRNSAIQAAG